MEYGFDRNAGRTDRLRHRGGAIKRLILDEILDAYDQFDGKTSEARAFLEETNRLSARALIGSVRDILQHIAGGGGTLRDFRTRLQYQSRVSELRTAMADHYLSDERKLFDEESVRRSQGMGLPDEPVRDRYAYHPAIDYVVGGSGDLYSGMSGQIAEIGEQGGYGNTVVINHGFNFEGRFFSSGFSTRQSHLLDRTFARFDLDKESALLGSGDWVSSHARLGRQGSTGSSTNAHVDFQLYHSSQYETPRFLEMFDLPRTNLGWHGTPGGRFHYDATDWLRQYFKATVTIR